MITSFDQLDPNKVYTFQDYRSWQFEDRVELHRGYVVRLFPVPNRKHQLISSRIHGKLFIHLQDSDACEVYSAPFDVRLSTGDAEGDTVVQPDLCVTCDPDKLTIQGCTGAPDLIVEILSPHDIRHDLRDKFSLYEAAGVPEYWIVDPRSDYVIRYNLNDENKFIGSEPYFAEDTIVSQQLPGFRLDLHQIF